MSNARRAIVLLTILGLLVIQILGTLAIVDAGVASIQSCSQAYVNVYEDTGPSGGDGLHVCYPVNFPNLDTTAHTQPGLCNAIVKVEDDWNDCISQARNVRGTETNHRSCFYTGINYTGSVYILAAGSSKEWFWPDTFADSISSFKWC